MKLSSYFCWMFFEGYICFYLLSFHVFLDNDEQIEWHAACVFDMEICCMIPTTHMQYNVYSNIMNKCI